VRGGHHDHFVPGDAVILHGLQVASHLHDRRGVVLSIVEVTGRYQVQLEDELQTRAVKVENLRPALDEINVVTNTSAVDQSMSAASSSQGTSEEAERKWTLERLVEGWNLLSGTAKRNENGELPPSNIVLCRALAEAADLEEWL